MRFTKAVDDFLTGKQVGTSFVIASNLQNHCVLATLHTNLFTLSLIFLVSQFSAFDELSHLF